METQLGIYEVRVRAPKAYPGEGEEYRYLVSAAKKDSIQSIINKFTNKSFREDRFREVLEAFEIKPAIEAVMDTEIWSPGGPKFYEFEPEHKFYKKQADLIIAEPEADQIKIYEVHVRAPKGAPSEGHEYRYMVSAKNKESIQGIIDNFSRSSIGIDRTREVIESFEIRPGIEAVMHTEEWPSGGPIFFKFEPESEFYIRPGIKKDKN